jgi:nitrous oxidase accessory protein NosD
MALVCAVSLLSGGCSSAGSTDELTPEEAAQEQRFRGCGALAAEIADATQAWVDAVAPAEGTAEEGSAEDGASPGTGEPDTQPMVVRNYQERRDQLGCRPREFQHQLGIELERVEGEGPGGRALAAAVRAQVLVPTGPPRSVEVDPDDDLQTAILRAEPGAVVRLAAGEHAIDEPLILLQPVTLIGAGRDETAVVSSAAGAAIAFLGEGGIRLADLEVRHTGEAPASVLVFTAGSVELTRVRATGGVANESGTSGFGVVLGGAAATGAGVTQELDEVEVADNAAGGVAVVDAAAPTIVASTASDNAGCGFCYLGSAGGRLGASTAVGNDVGVALGDTADPVVDQLRASGNRQAGIVVEAEATGSFQDAVVRDNGPIGVLVRDDAAPTLAGPTIEGHDEAAIVFGGRAGGTVRDAACTDGGLGIVLFEAADPDVTEPGCAVHDERS